LTHFGTEVEALVEQECLFVLVSTKSVYVAVLVLLVFKFLFTLLVRPLDHQLVLKFLPGASDCRRRVFENEFRVAFGGKRSYNIELALGNFDNRFFGRVTKEVLANCL
jgi:hypothetical protein